MNSIETDLVCGLIGILLFIFRNPDKRLLYLTSLFAFGLFISQIVYLYVGIFSGQAVWIVSASGLLISYTVRFSSKEERRILDLLKMIGLLLLIIYPLPFYDLVNVGDNVFWTVTRLSTFPVLGTVYLYDRWILKPEKMKKKYLIVLVGQSIMILLMLVYSFVQSAEAQRQTELAVKQTELAAKELLNARQMQVRYEEMEIKYQDLVKERSR